MAHLSKLLKKNFPAAQANAAVGSPDPTCLRHLERSLARTDLARLLGCRAGLPGVPGKAGVQSE